MSSDTLAAGKEIFYEGENRRSAVYLSEPVFHPVCPGSSDNMRLSRARIGNTLPLTITFLTRTHKVSFIRNRGFWAWRRIRSVLQLSMRIQHNSGPRIRTGSITSAPITVKSSFSGTRRDIRASTPISASSPAGRRVDFYPAGKSPVREFTRKIRYYAKQNTTTRV